jgi:NAD+ synthase
MRRRLASTGARGFVLGLSGGLDSAVVARLAQLAAPGNVVAAILPCHSDPEDERDAATIAAHFALTAIRIDLSHAYDTTIAAAQAALQALPEQTRAPKPADPIRARLPFANVKPRLRMTTLYFLANSLDYLVAGTSNRSEISIGYFTKHGDGGSDLLPIGHLVKSEVEMGFTYGDLERHLEEGPQGVPPALAMKIERLTRSSEHKRVLPPTPDSD